MFFTLINANSAGMAMEKYNQQGNRKGGSYDPFDRFFRSGFIDLWRQEYPETIPSVNISETPDAYKVELAVPGMAKEDFNIDVDDNTMVTVSCQKEGEKQDEKYARREYNYSSFSRSFSIPENANGEAITAKYENGILKLTIPKKNAAESKKSSKVNVD